MKKIVYIGGVNESSLERMREYISEKNKKWEIVLLQEPESIAKKETVYLDFSDERSLKKWVDENGKDILCVSARGEKNIPLFQKIIPFLPENVLVPSVDALQKSTEKTLMRKAFKKSDPSITPKFKIIKNLDEDFDVKSIMKNLQFPVIVKPSGLAASLLIQSAHYPEELEEILKKMKKKISSIYKEQKGRGTPAVLVEELLEGTIYSVDAYVNNFGEISFTPFVKYKTSAQKGFDDFFLYERLAPAKLSKEKIARAQIVATKGVHALGLKNTTTHIELVITESGEWKIIEIGPRIGGNRETLYEKCYGINHTLNDLLTRMHNKKPVIKEKILGYLSTIYFYPKKEGFIKEIKGVKKAKKLISYLESTQHLKKGGKSLYAKNGGSSVLKVTLFNTDKEQFIEDKRKLEKMIHIETKTRHTK